MSRKPKYPFTELAIGEAFTVPAGSVSFASLRAYAYGRGQELGRRFTTTLNRDGSMTVARREMVEPFEIHKAPEPRRPVTMKDRIAEVTEARRAMGLED